MKRLSVCVCVRLSAKSLAGEEAEGFIVGSKEEIASAPAVVRRSFSRERRRDLASVSAFIALACEVGAGQVKVKALALLELAPVPIVALSVFSGLAAGTGLTGLSQMLVSCGLTPGVGGGSATGRGGYSPLEGRG